MTNYIKRLSAWVAAVIAVLTTTSAKVQPGYGISSWAGWDLAQVSRADCPELQNVPLNLK